MTSDENFRSPINPVIEKQLASFIHTADDAILGVDHYGKITIWNKAATRMFGYHAKQALGMDLHDLLVPDPLFTTSKKGFEAFVKTQKNPQIGKITECTARRENGSEFPAAFSISGFEHEGHWQTTTIIRDITKHKQTEQQMKQREYQQTILSKLGLLALSGLGLDALLQRTTELVAETLEVEYCKFLELQSDGKALLLRAGVGWKEGRVGHTTVGLETESQAGYTLKSDHPVIVEDLRTETRFRSPSLLQEHRVISGMSVVIPGTTQPWGVLGTHTKVLRAFSEEDIHFIQAVANFLALAIDRKQTEATLTTSEARHRNLVDNLKEVVFQTDAEGHWTFLNPAWREVTGFSVEESLGNIFLESVFPDDRERNLELFKPLIERKKDFCRHEVRYCYKNGGFRWVEVFARLTLDENDKVLGTTGTLSDVTERKQSETTFQEIIKNTAGTTGQNFFTSVSKNLCEWLGATCAIISEITRENHVEMLGMQLDGKSVNQFGYDLFGTPCANVIAEGYCEYPEKIQELFPDDKDLVEIQAEGYVGVSLRGRNGNPIGVLCVLSRHKLKLPPKTQEVFEIIAAKAGVEIERKQAKDELGHREVEYQSLYRMIRRMCDNMPDMIWAKDTEKRYTFANKALCDHLLHAQNTDEPIGKMDMFFAERERNTHTDDPQWHTFGEICSDSDAITLQNGKAEQFDEFGNVRGKFLFLDVHKAPMLDEKGKVIGIVGSARDVTEARQTERNYGRLVEFSPEPIAVHRDGKWIYVNPAAINLFGGNSSEDLIGKDILQFVHPDFRDIVIERVQKEIVGDSPSPLIEEKLLRLNGQLFDAEVVAIPIDFEGRRAALVIARDITVRKQAERALQEEQAQTRQIIETARDAFVSMGSDGIITDWNSCAEAMFGWSRKQAIGRKMCETIIPEEFREAHNEGLKHYLATGEGFVFNQYVESTAQHRDGRQFMVELSIVATQTGETTCFNAFIRDVSEQVQAREVLKKNREQLRASLIGTITAISRAAGARDLYTAGHQLRVSQLSKAIAQEMGLGEGQIYGLKLGASIHDIGKINIPAEILAKPTILTETEFMLVKNHSQIGYEILKDIVFPWPVADIAYQHHERLDGSGYPQGLKGDEICLEARIVAVADVVEAMSNHRPYRPALGVKAALQEIEKNRGKLFDSVAVDACLTLCREKNFSFEDILN